ncbi:siphovirus ReqiPepy6 Gp37-like family protein, partial [Virgibacillus salexigens]|uniref:siphovirus ReqiPepy6 Gp37-like family protein n=1 Tax=Virgibacillus salexigens TaxID=61016 RepID=UPI003081BFC5
MKVPIRIYNRFLDFEGEIDTYQSLQFGRSFHSIADVELHVNRYMHEAKKLTKGDIIGLGKQANKAAIILTKEIALDENGEETENFKITGCTLDGLTIRRITVPPSHTAYDRKSGNAETVMKHYVMNHFVNPVDLDRKMPHIEVAPNQKRGPYIEWESRFKNVAEELESISIKSGLGWGIFANFKTKKLIFDVIEAKDLTQGNQYGYDPVFFSPEFDTIKSQSYVDSDKDLKTVGYVGGQGEGIDRQIITVGSKTGWDRIETFIDARDVGDSEDKELSPEEIEQQLIERGQSKMSEMETLRSLEAEIKTPIKDVTPFQYEKQYDLGDKVQVVNKSWGLTMEAPITEFKEIHESAGFRLEATFGRSRPTLISKIKDKFNELDGIEKQELPAQIAVETRKYTDQEVYREEQERIEQSKENLEASKNFTKDYAEKKRVESSTEPEDKDVIWVDTSDPDNVVWKIWNEAEGKWKAGPGGPQGIPGPPGENGQTLYTWLKYADSPTSGMSDSPDGKEYIGLAYNKTTPTESTNYNDYTWAKTKGPQGVPGEPGKDGEPRYTWVKYADDKNGNGMADSPENKRYLGLAYNKSTATESNDPADYNWSPLYDNVNVGGRNLYKGSTQEDRTIAISQYGNSNLIGQVKLTDTELKNGDVITVSAYFSSIPPGEAVKLRFDWLKDDGTYLIDAESGYFSEEGRHSYTSKIPESNEYTGLQVRVYPYKYTSDYNIKVRNEKLEKGNVATDWTPAPEDVEKDATDKANQAEENANNHTDGIIDANKPKWDRALFFNEDGTLNVENLKGLLTDDQLESAARWNGRTTKIGDDGIYTGTMIAEQIIAGIFNADKVEIKGANGGVTINAQGVNAKNAAFTLEDDESSMPYNVTPQRNIVKDHSFELVIPDYGSMGSGSVNYNWLEMVLSDVPTENFWTKSGSPKVAVVLGPSDRSALPIFGEQAIVVRDANFVRQILWDGIAAGMTFTATGYFKRQHNVVGGGTPRFEIDHLDAGGNFKARLTNTIFP